MLPRFYGRSGQGDRGIDLLVQKDGKLMVYQSKNLKAYYRSDLQEALAKFKSEWLDDPAALSRPDEYYLFAPLDLLDRPDNDK